MTADRVLQSEVVRDVVSDRSYTRVTIERETGSKARTLACNASRCARFQRFARSAVPSAVMAGQIKLTDPRWWAAQTPERLPQSAALLGVHPELSEQAADAIAFRLAIPRLVLREATADYARARGRAARGRVLVGVLDQLGSVRTRACSIACWRPAPAQGAGGR